MSILKKPYEISVWEDEWDESIGKFTERKICVIGSDAMTSQSRATSPNLIRNVNGSKRLTFKMYYKYKDTITGEDVINPFVGLLVAERKVKLKYKGRWYDFIVKDIDENSSTYVYSYQLEDAIVQELSKNGYSATLDEKLQNNMGTAAELANEVLKETDWTADSEAIVQTIEEALVYLKVNEPLIAYHLLDQKDYGAGVAEEMFEGTQTPKLISIPAGASILAFYSSCTEKPHRFQFIYVPELDKITRDEERYITNENCQYYIDDYGIKYTINGEQKVQQLNYKTDADSYGFYLPAAMSVTETAEYIADTTETTQVVLSGRYRGKRYGYSQQAKYIPALDRYAQLYKGADGKTYYGYESVEYRSPALIQNLVSGSTFESTSGWTGTKLGGTEKATVENVFGYFDRGNFISAESQITSGIFDASKNKAFMKLAFAGNSSAVVNSGPWDNRTIIENMEVGSEWGLIAKGTDVDALVFSLGEYAYDSKSDGYKAIEGNIVFNEYGSEDLTKTENNGVTAIWKVTGSSFSNKAFKKDSKVRLLITGSGTVYLEEFIFFKITRRENGTIILPHEATFSADDRLIERTHYFFTDKEVEKITDKEDFKPLDIKHKINYNEYVPVYNEGAQKIRSVTAKESNYFNILQSIAETFEAWLDLEITRDNEGSIIDKKVKFKNYIGKNNYAGFKYGVNLKEIQRTKGSKNIVTKLIVKENNNQHAENGFCTIARAGANPTGETNIYDFQYFFNMGLLDATNYLNTLYKVDGAAGGDITPWPENTAEEIKKKGTNLIGYFPRIKKINNELTKLNEKLVNLETDLTQYKAELEVAKAGLEAAESGIEQVNIDFEKLSGTNIGNAAGASQTVTITKLASGVQASAEEAREVNGYFYYSLPTGVTLSVNYSGNKITITGNNTTDTDVPREVYLYPKCSDGGTRYLVINCDIKKNTSNQTWTGYVARIIDSGRSDVSKLLNEYAIYQTNQYKYSEDKERLEGLVAGLESQKEKLNGDIETQKEYKTILNQIFFSRYSRFIQEGTWMDEKYYEDDLYYADALSVMYNSCYPQVAYNIGVLALDGLEGYEAFSFDIGDKTHIEDPEFFGDKYQEEVIVNELSEDLDDPIKNVIKVQNFKNQFQDLFQKITATVQQAQYSTGAYEKAVALAEANQAQKQSFLTGALDAASARLMTAGQQSVTWGNDGITVKSVDSPCDAIRMVGGAILLSKQDKNGQQKWVTGVTSDGVSASLITAGTLNTGEINIMSGDEPAFRWDVNGISAYSYESYESPDAGQVISGMDANKFVRFDRHGIYGIEGQNGQTWRPGGLNQDPLEDINNKANFALTWEGLKVTGSDGVVAHIGKQSWEETLADGSKTPKDGIVRIKKANDENVLTIDNDGNLSMTGTIYATGGKIGSVSIEALEDLTKTSRNMLMGTSSVPTEIPNSPDALSYELDKAASGEKSYVLSFVANIQPVALSGDFRFTFMFFRAANTLAAVATVKIPREKFNKDLKIEIILLNDATSMEIFIDGQSPEDEDTLTYSRLSSDFTKLQCYAATANEYAIMKISKVQLEEGTRATEWSPHKGEENVLDVNSNDFSWLFSKTAGMKMWNGPQDNDPLFKIDETGLTLTGTVYATGGEIGGVKIETLESVLDTSNENLLYGTSSLGLTSGTAYLLTESLENINYTISAALRNATTSSKTASIQLRLQTSSSTITTQTIGSFSFSGNETKNIEFTFNPASWGVQHTLADRILIYIPSQSHNFYINSAKLEKGAEATSWKPAKNELNSSGSYSWLFSPKNGLYMYKGSRDTTPVFKVDSSGVNIQGSGTYSWNFSTTDGLYMYKGAQTTTPIFKVSDDGLVVKGTIQADSGYIGDETAWLIENDRLSTTYTASPQEQSYTHQFIVDLSSSGLHFAGKNKQGTATEALQLGLTNVGLQSGIFVPGIIFEVNNYGKLTTQGIQNNLNWYGPRIGARFMGQTDLKAAWYFAPAKQSVLSGGNDTIVHYITGDIYSAPLSQTYGSLYVGLSPNFGQTAAASQTPLYSDGQLTLTDIIMNLHYRLIDAENQINNIWGP